MTATTQFGGPGDRPSGRGIRSICVSSVLVLTAVLTASVSVAPTALADSVDDLQSAVAQARAGSCGPLRLDPIVQQAAVNVDQSTDKWVDHIARAQPVPEALPLLKDLGYPGNKGTIIQGAAATEGDAIKGLLLQGYKDIPDCSYTDFGVSFMKSQTTDNFYASAVLAGP